MTITSDVSRRRFLQLTGLAAGGIAVGAESASAREADAPAEGDGRSQRAPRIDAAVPLASPARGLETARSTIDGLVDDGVDVAFVPVAEIDGFEAATRHLLRLHALVEATEGVVYVRSVADLRRVLEDELVGVVPTFQGMEMIVEAMDLVPVFRRAGVGVMALTHAWRNWNGEGCFEASDRGLTVLGRNAVAALQDAEVLLDLSRVGRRSSLEAMELAAKPVVFTHSNADAVHAHPRNLTDRQIDACAATDGVVCVTAFPALVGGGTPTLEALLRHVDHVAERVGPRHVGVGLDVDRERLIRFPSDPLPEPPYEYPAELTGGGPRFPPLADRLAARGYAEAEVDGILGGNLHRVLLEAWSG